ncbi:MAG: Asp-tRNA(Asn)/Glu-tRNA(Gln) amidotransferase GatCAB subunit A, partial [Gammaproteobacteria bacterium]
VVAPAEASSNLSRFDGVRFGHRAEGVDGIGDLYRKSRDEGFGAEVKRRILIGTYVLSAGYYDAYYTQARKVRRLISDDFDRVFTDVDVIAGPTTPDVAFGKGEEVDDPVAMYLNDLYTVAANLAGIPALSMPCGMKSGLPIGLQLIGRSRDESTLFRLAHAYQQATDWHRQRAPLFSAADGEGR